MKRSAKLLISLTAATVAILLLLQILAAEHRLPDTTQGSDLVNTEWGQVHGFQSGDAFAFLGIPYAAPPVGDLRWRPPVDPQPWDEEREATAFGPACPQWDDDAEAVIGAEDCLTLNVWTPVTATSGSNLPVMVFLHGGGNVQGSAAKPLYDSQFIAERGGVVVVSLQYRLGALGFLVHPALSAESDYGGSGNYGLMDQIKALAWVRDNIENFGGDPARVLLFGESGGAEDTCMLMASPLAEGLFSRALMQSGGCVAKTAVTRSAEGVAFARAAGCGSDPNPILCLRQQVTTTLVTAVDTTPITNGLVTQAFGSNIDGYVLPQSPYNALALAETNHVPFIVGSNADEMLPLSPVMSDTLYTVLIHAMLDPIRPGAGVAALALYPVGSGPDEYPTPQQAYGALVSDAQFTCPARRIVRLAAASSDKPVYRYFFTRVIDSPLYEPLGAFHGLELSYVFQRVADLQFYQPKLEDTALEAAMLGYWTRFAAAGSPNGADAAAWPLYAPSTDPYLELGTEIVAGAGIRPEKCNFWDGIAEASFALRLETAVTPVQAGQPLTYTISLINSGGNASGVAISDTLDGNTTFLWASEGGMHDSGVVTWDVGPLTATQRVTRTLAVKVGEDVLSGTQLTNSIFISSNEAVTAAKTITTWVTDSEQYLYLPIIIR